MKRKILFVCIVLLVVSGLAHASVSVELVDTQEDRVSTQGVFAPGPGFSGDLRNDWHWQARLNLSEPKTIKSILIEHNIAGEAWTTSSSRRYGKDLYPIVVLKNGEQLNHRYDNVIDIPESETILDLYGQIESHPFAGANIVFEYTDGTSHKIDIPPSILAVTPLPLSGMGCSDFDGGADYKTTGTVDFMVDGEKYNYVDYCLSDKIVAEGMCGGPSKQQLVLSHGVCEGGCSAGACGGGGSNFTDFAGSVRRVNDGLELTFHTDRQRSIEYMVILDLGREEYLSNVMYRGEPVIMGNGGASQTFEPGEYKLNIYPNSGANNFSQGKLWIVFTDGSKVIYQME